jgi:hypothetical protein
MRQFRLDVAGDLSDISDMHFDTIGTETKKYLQEKVNKKF